jgi:hypothetical protein
VAPPLTCILATNRDDIGDYLLALEIFFTVVFSVEYILRVACLQSPGEFIFSLLGFIDICAIVPSYLGAAHGGSPLAWPPPLTRRLVALQDS